MNKLQLIVGRMLGYVQKSSIVGPALRFIGLGEAIWTPREYDKLIDAAYMRNVIAYRAVGLIAKSIGGIPICVKDEKGDEVPNHPLLKILKRPNPQQAWPEFIERAVSFFCLSGNMYIEKRVQGEGLELYAHRPDRIKIIAGPFGFPARFDYSVGGGRPVQFVVDPMTGMGDMLHIKTFHPLNDWYGMSPIEAAATSVDMHNQASVWNKRLLQNSGVPSGAFSYKPNEMQHQSLTHEQYTRLEQMMDERMTGPENAGRPYILDGGLQWQSMGLSPRDTDWMEGRNMSAREICFAFGTPAFLLGIPGDATYSNMEEARLSFYEETVLPVGGLVLCHIGKWLGEAFGLDEGLELCFDLDEVPALYERRKQKWDMVSQANCLTINEKRQALGYKKLDSPMADEVLIDGTPRPLDDVGLEPEAPMGKEKDEGDDDEGTKKDKGKLEAGEDDENVKAEVLERDMKGKISVVRLSEVVRRA